MVVDGDGNGAGGPGKISADHKDHAKFAQSVSESENDGRDYTGERKRKSDTTKSAPGTCAENARGGEKFGIETLERGDERLDTERKTVKNACEDKAGKGESECVTEKKEPELAKRAARAHGDEEIKTENGGRQYERKSDNGFDDKFGAEFGKGEPMGYGRGDDEQDRCDKKSEAEGEQEFLHRSANYSTGTTLTSIRAKPYFFRTDCACPVFI